MKNKIFKFIAIGAVTAIISSLCLVTPSHIDKIAYGASGDSPHSIQECREGNLELLAFLQTIISYRGFVRGITDPFLDLFRNDCQTYDVFILDRQLDNIKRNIQNAFLMCDREKIPAMERAYYEIDAELFYVRRILKVSPLSAAKETLSKVTMDIVTLNRDNDKFTSRKNMYDDMYAFYVKKASKFSPSEFDDFFNILESKYAERMKSYVKCEETGWRRVKEKLVEFVENLGGLRGGWEGIERQVGEGAERIVNSARSLPEMKSFVKDIFDMKVNGVPPLQGFGEIADSISANNFLSGMYETMDQSTLLNALGNARRDFDLGIDEAKLRAKYIAMYKGNSDAYLSEFLRALDETQFYLLRGIAYLYQVETCVQNMVNKQCP